MELIAGAPAPAGLWDHEPGGKLTHTMNGLASRVKGGWVIIFATATPWEGRPMLKRGIQATCILATYSLLGNNQHTSFKGEKRALEALVAF